MGPPVRTDQPLGGGAAIPLSTPPGYGKKCAGAGRAAQAVKDIPLAKEEWNRAAVILYRRSDEQSSVCILEKTHRFREQLVRCLEILNSISEILAPENLRSGSVRGPREVRATSGARSVRGSFGIRSGSA